MIVAFSKDKHLINLKECDLVVFGFCDFTPLFMTKEYLERVRNIKKYSLKTSCQFVLTFYVLIKNKKCVCAVRIKNGKILDLFGECFSRKYLKFRVKSKLVNILFYYDLYGKRGRDISRFSSLTIAVDNQPFDNLEYLNNKFFNKLILVELNNKVICENFKKNEKQTKNVIKYHVQNFSKLLK